MTEEDFVKSHGLEGCWPVLNEIEITSMETVTNSPMETVTNSPMETVMNSPMETVTNSPMETVTNSPIPGEYIILIVTYV
jgi:hypothetical protein